jgi:hypothetical protein
MCIASYFYFFLLSVEAMNNFSKLFFILTVIFIIVGFIDLGIRIYIIRFKNNPVAEKTLSICYNCAVVLLPMVGALHVTSNTPFISPNPVSNWYHKHTFLGRGFGAWSSGHLLQVDSIKSHLGSEFKCTEVVDANQMLDSRKIKCYEERYSIILKYFLEIKSKEA